MTARIPLSRVFHSHEIDQRILQVVHRGQYILGPECNAFEQELAAYLSVPHVVLSSSWTAAVHLLHAAQITLGHLRPGDEVLVPSLTAFPTIEPMIHAGLKPIFCEVDASYTIDLEDARKRLTSKTRGILPVHLYGRPADMDAVCNFARGHELIVMEDCAQALGARWAGRRAGAIGDHAAFSFYPSKNLTVYGDGGAVATRDGELAALVRMLRNHGRADKNIHEHVGYNLRFNEIQAAVGREQLLRLDELNAKRRQAAEWYRRELAGVPSIMLPPTDAPSAPSYSVYHLFVIRVADRVARERLAAALREQGIETGVHYPIPNHRQPAVARSLGEQPALPFTDAIVDQILSMPIFPGILEAEVVEVCEAIKQFMRRR